jgi:histidyl-tRNA synthetase
MQRICAGHAIILVDAAQQGLALLIADELHAAKLCAEVLFDGSLKSRMRKANTMGAQYVLLIGEDEQAQRQVTVKHMTKGTEMRVAQDALISLFKI